MTLTTESVAAGLNRERVKTLPAVVDPPAKAHWGESWDAHGAVLHPPVPDTSSLATTPPPAKVNDDAVLPAGMPVAGFTTTLLRGGTSTERRTVGVAPPLSS